MKRASAVLIKFEYLDSPNCWGYYANGCFINKGSLKWSPNDRPTFTQECPMNNEAIVRSLVRGSIQRAIQESVGALIVMFFFGALLPGAAVGSPMYYGCLMILVGTGFIAGVVWSYALSYRLLRSHPADDVVFWRAAFQTQARLLRMVPLWYCAPLSAVAMLFIAPKTVEESVAFLMVAGIFAVVFVAIIWINRRAAACIEESAKLLTT